MSDTLEVRIAHLEGAYEQVDKRLGGVETALIQLRSDMNSSFTQLRADLNSSTQQLRTEANQLRTELVARINSSINAQTGRMDSQFHWLLGMILTTWVTMLLAIFFRR